MTWLNLAHTFHHDIILVLKSRAVSELSYWSMWNVFDSSTTAYKCRCTRKGPKIRYKDVQKLEIKPKHPYCQEKMILWVRLLFFLSLHLPLVFSRVLSLLLTSSSPIVSPTLFHGLSFPLFLHFLTFSPLKLFSPFNIPSSCFPFSFPKRRCTMYLSLSKRHIYSCNYTLTALQDTIKTALQLYRHYQNILSSVFQALSRVHSVII